jgi:hypothetical protein
VLSLRKAGVSTLKAEARRAKNDAPDQKNEAAEPKIVPHDAESRPKKAAFA